MCVVNNVSRRQFVLGSTAGLFATRLRGQSGKITAQDVVDRIKANVGLPWRTATVDGIKAGDPMADVTGVATTAIATLPMLRRAAGEKLNFIVTQEPVFYSATDAPGNLANDPVYLAKKKFIDDEKLVIFRFSDHWAARQPNLAADQLARNLGWKPPMPVVDQVYEIPERTLETIIPLSNLPGTRLVGDPKMKVRRVFVSPGTTTLPATMAALQRADAVLAGEPREWEAVPYVLDSAVAGQPKGMVIVGRVVSEDPGRGACADWVKSLFPEIPTAHLTTADPYWNANERQRVSPRERRGDSGAPASERVGGSAGAQPPGQL